MGIELKKRNVKGDDILKSRKELLRIVKKETERKKRIREFLMENEGQYYTSDEIIEKLGIKCAGRLLRKMEGCDDKYVSWYSLKRYKVGIEEIEIPLHPEKEANYCAYENYYGYLNTLPKNKRKER